MAHAPTPSTRPRRPYMVAMVLGTALTALGAPPEAAAQAAPQTLEAIGDIGRYCNACWRNARLPESAWSDCTQEVFSRLLQRVPTSSWPSTLKREGDERRELIRAIDAVKKRTQRARRAAPAPQDIPDLHDVRRRRLDDEREAVRRASQEVLTPRQQRIVQMSLEGWSVQDIAAELSLAVERVSDEKYKAIRRLRGHLREDDAAL